MSDFPTALSAVVDNVNDVLAKYINNIEAKLGIDSSAVTSSHDYKLSGVTGSDKAASLAGAETLTTKTLTSPVIQAYDGWIDANEEWAYASASTITVPSGAALKYAKGDKIKLTQTTVKYFYVVGVADTLLTVTGGSDYTVANSAITDIYYSHASSPIGFPNWFSHASVFVGFSANPAGVFHFRIIGGKLEFNIIHSANGTSNATTFNQTLPVTAIAEERSQCDASVDNNAIVLSDDNHLAWLIRSIDYTKIFFYKDNSESGWTSANGKRIISVSGSYFY